MNEFTAKSLTALFREKARGRRLDFHTARIMLETESGSRLVIYPATPADAASHLTFIKNSGSPLFTPRHAFQQTYEPVIFALEGEFERGVLSDRRLHRAQAFMFRFFNFGTQAQLLPGEDFLTDPAQGPQLSHGPVIDDFIRVLQKAGQDWNAVDFSEMTPPSRQGPNRRHLRLVRPGGPE